MKKNLHGSGKVGIKGFNLHYSYDLGLDCNSVSIDGTDLKINFKISGGAKAGVTVLWVPYDLGFIASAAPNPTVDCSLTISGDQLVVTEKSLSVFTILLSPDGAISWVFQLIGVGAIIDLIVLAATPIVSQVLKGIRFGSYQIPTYTETYGVPMTFTPTNLAVENVDGNIGLLGDITIS
jgi:hypothetical protein